jgi:hypothetical protein
METYSKVFNIHNFTSHSLNPNIYVFHNNSWKQNSTYGEFYGSVISDVFTPQMLIQPYNPYKNIEILSYRDILIIYKKLLKFQNFVEYLCLNCNLSLNSIIDQYIDLVDDWIIYDGNILLPFSYYLTSQNIDFDIELVRTLNYYSTNTTIPFIDVVMNNYGGLETVLWKNDPIDPNDDRVNSFMINYVNNDGKIGKLVNAVYEYELLFLDVDSSSCDLPSDLFDRISEKIRLMAYEFYEINHNCTKISISNPGSSPTYSAYIKMPIHFTNDIDDLGIFFTSAQIWECGKRYEPGDSVIMNGVVYTPSNSFAGWYNEKSNKIFFDKTEIDSDGFPTGELIMNGFDYTNFKRSVMDTATAVTIQARWDSQLMALRAYRKGLTNWFDEEGFYKIGVRFNEQQVDDVGAVKYESFITDIQETMPEIGHDVITYTYIMDQLNTNPYPQTGVQFKDEYHRYKISTNDYHYDFGQRSYVVYQAKTLGNYSMVYKGNNGIFPFGDTDRFDYFPLSKKDYYVGLTFEPVIIKDVKVDRQINRAFDKHMALAECKSFFQIMNYRNGSFFKILDLTDTNNMNEITQRD